ncbi:hypothetical protein [Streptomyces sp. NPDC002853]
MNLVGGEIELSSAPSSLTRAPRSARSRRWQLCASFTVYALIGLAGVVVAQAAAGAGPRRSGLLAHSLPPLIVVLLTGAFGGRLPAAAVV